MLIKKISLTNFKCHSNSQYLFANTNHFFGDNYTGKSSIGEAIVFCLYGVTKHGYKGYIKDYLQDGAKTMKVAVTLVVKEQEYIIERNMNSRGSTSVFINKEEADDKYVKKMIGEYQSFIYCFFPDVFPLEEKNTARSFLINLLKKDKDELGELENEKNRLLKQQKNVNSSKTFYEGQKKILKQQMEAKPNNQNKAIHVDMQNYHCLQTRLTSLNKELENILKEGYQLQARVKGYKDKLQELEVTESSMSEYCPTCHQKIPEKQLHSIRSNYQEKRKSLNNELTILEKKQIEERQLYKEMLSKKNLAEEKLNAIDIPIPQNEVSQKQWIEVENKLKELEEEKNTVSKALKVIKHQMGQLANSYQNKINQHLKDTRLNLFKELKSGDLRPDFFITYKNRPYRVLSYSEQIRCMMEVINFINNQSKAQYPIFLDNLESITHLVPPDTQIITATVKKGLPLTLKIKDGQVSHFPLN